MARNIRDVIAAIIKVVPVTEVELLSRLGSCDQDALFTAPEAMRKVWLKLCNSLEATGAPTTEWQKQAEAIISGKVEVPEIKR